MDRFHLAESVTINPEAATRAFERLDDALNLVLPGGYTHKRYREYASVGLAVVVGKDILAHYDPFLPNATDRLSFMANDQEKHPETWAPKETDEQILGGPIPEGMGRFTAFAMAKINSLSRSPNKSSFLVYRSGLERGQVGLAGGRELDSSLIGVSGLWEVHDHIAGEIYRDEVVLENDTNTSGRTADDLAGEIDPILDMVKYTHRDIEAADLSLNAVKHLLKASDGIVAFRRSLRNSN